MTDRHTQKPYPLRMPDEVRERLERSAKDAGRSLNAEIVRRLESTLAAPVEHRMLPLPDQEVMLRILNEALQNAIDAGVVPTHLDASGRPLKKPGNPPRDG